MTASRRLLGKMALGQPILAAEAQSLWSSPHVRHYYLLYLRTMHMIVRSAIPLMHAARDRSHLLAPYDAVAAGLVDYFDQHAREEAGHDLWILEDLVAAGGEPEDALDAIPSPRIANYVGAQYYWLRHYHPVALLGHIGALETYHPKAGFAKRLQGLTGLPRSAFRAIARHEILDLRHKAELYELIDGLELSAEHETMLGISALHTIDSAILVLRELFEMEPPKPTADGRPAIAAVESPVRNRRLERR